MARCRVRPILTAVLPSQYQDWVGSRAFVQQAQQKRLAQITTAASGVGNKVRRTSRLLTYTSGEKFPGGSERDRGEAFPAELTVILASEVGDHKACCCCPNPQGQGTLNQAVILCLALYRQMIPSG